MSDSFHCRCAGPLSWFRPRCGVRFEISVLMLHVLALEDRGHAAAPVLRSITDDPTADRLRRLAIDPVLLGHAYLWLAQLEQQGELIGMSTVAGRGIAHGCSALRAAEIFRTCLGERHSLTVSARAVLDSRSSGVRCASES